jgi:hypothetical protein
VVVVVVGVVLGPVVGAMLARMAQMTNRARVCPASAVGVALAEQELARRGRVLAKVVPQTFPRFDQK